MQRVLIMTLLRFIYSLTVLLCLGYGSAVVAQTSQGNTGQLDLNKDLADQLLPLEQLYQLALLNSPAIQDQKAQIDIQVESNRIAKTSLLNSVGVSGGYSASNQSALAAGIGAVGVESIQISSGYRAGVSAGISLGTLLNYRGTIRQGQAAYRSAIAKQNGIKLGLRRDISQLYQTLLMNQKIINAYIQEEQKALIVFQTAEIDWRNGRLDVGEYAGASSRYTEIRIKTEQARGGLLSNLYDISALVGVDMSRLKVR